MTRTRPTLAAIVCAYNESQFLAPCLHSLLAQTRPPDEIIVVNNASTDDTAEVARRIGVRVVDEPRRGLVVARETARRSTTADILAYVDADCRVPLQWAERVLKRFSGPAVVAVTGPYRFYDWDDWIGRWLVRGYDMVVAPPTHVVVQYGFNAGAILYGGNFAVRRDALERIGGFDQRIEFHGEDTNLGRRLAPIGSVRLTGDCWVWTSARRYRAMGKGKVFRLYIRNFWSEVLRHRPADVEHSDIRA